MGDSGDVERRAPVAVAVLAQVEIVAGAVQPGRQQADAVPVVEPSVDERQLRRLGLDERGRERRPKATGDGFHGGRFFRRRLAQIIIALEGSRSAKAYRALAGLRAPHASFRRL
jgi:hypothetical protein